MHKVKAVIFWHNETLGEKSINVANINSSILIFKWVEYGEKNHIVNVTDSVKIMSNKWSRDNS